MNNISKSPLNKYIIANTDKKKFYNILIRNVFISDLNRRILVYSKVRREIASRDTSTMFRLRGETNGDTKFKEILKQDDFGWWLSDEDDLKSPTSACSKDRLSLGSSESMFSCIDSDDTENYFLAQEFKQECKDNYEKIELTSLIHEDLDLNLIEQDAIKKESVSGSYGLFHFFFFPKNYFRFLSTFKYPRSKTIQFF